MSEIRIKVGGKYKGFLYQDGVTSDVEYEVRKFLPDGKTPIDGHNYEIKVLNGDLLANEYVLDENGNWNEYSFIHFKTTEIIKEPEITSKDTEISTKTIALNGGIKLILSLEVGKEYIDVDGDRVKIVHKTNSGKFIGLIENVKSHGEEGLMWYYKNGENIDSSENIIKEAPKTHKVEIWVNVYKEGVGSLCDTQEMAESCRSDRMDFLETVYFVKEVEIPNA